MVRNSAPLFAEKSALLSGVPGVGPVLGRSLQVCRSWDSSIEPRSPSWSASLRSTMTVASAAAYAEPGNSRIRVRRALICVTISALAFELYFDSARSSSHHLWFAQNQSNLVGGAPLMAFSMARRVGPSYVLAGRAGPTKLFRSLGQRRTGSTNGRRCRSSSNLFSARRLYFFFHR
jgi:hypothetical protein